ncbi:MAG: holo-[acyl-carrier-protein] synthase [Deltaproteobacteria bacterium CG_4_10_14_0_2_um_filter_43_8]|nr:MAG: holo-[acyl-carrier-protein] synthase [Deltaproteobacteria bacterium CG11_big_fil_rev_8_21_14_0_20_42_23]PJA20390.1 MAG: holo-[acyl-carrier-protein] synthase [Deltaproteobacteria bacterium CG_4_10_14_0_2_um_filter_43_8]PJC63789.1 MAG: holo-[acyl-carrier-protein] synthase [Deltaproteobacteria bacterium CG_4_9_14_0_2_um_filter_42_21]
MIFGIGVDLVEVRRIEAIIFRWEDRFLKKIFTDAEIKYCNNKKNPSQRFATRFAAKQAFIKALYPKGSEGVEYRAIEIAQEDRPTVILSGEVKRKSDEAGINKVHLMVSHDGNYAIANVVLEKKG